MSSRNAEPTGAMECPLCLGEGKLQRVEVLERLGMRDFARVAQLSAEEAFRLLSKRHQNGEQASWARFESELAKRTCELEREHNQELQTLKARLSAKDQFQSVELDRLQLEADTKIRAEQVINGDLNRRAQDALREVNELRQRNQSLEAEMAKVARVGRREELDFAEEAQSWRRAIRRMLQGNIDLSAKKICYRLDAMGLAMSFDTVVGGRPQSINVGGLGGLAWERVYQKSYVKQFIYNLVHPMRRKRRATAWMNLADKALTPKLLRPTSASKQEGTRAKKASPRNVPNK